MAALSYYYGCTVTYYIIIATLSLLILLWLHCHIVIAALSLIILLLLHCYWSYYYGNTVILLLLHYNIIITALSLIQFYGCTVILLWLHCHWSYYYYCTVTDHIIMAALSYYYSCTVVDHIMIAALSYYCCTVTDHVIMLHCHIIIPALLEEKAGILWYLRQSSRPSVCNVTPLLLDHLARISKLSKAEALWMRTGGTHSEFWCARN